MRGPGPHVSPPIVLSQCVRSSHVKNKFQLWFVFCSAISANNELWRKYIQLLFSQAGLTRETSQTSLKILKTREGEEQTSLKMGQTRLLFIFLTILPILTLLSVCETSEVDSGTSAGGGATFNETQELSEVKTEEEKEEEEEESEDEEEAFNDLEDETMLCADYVPQTRNKRLPDAIIIGARKVQRKMVYTIHIETHMTPSP